MNFSFLFKDILALLLRLKNLQIKSLLKKKSVHVFYSNICGAEDINFQKCIAK